MIPIVLTATITPNVDLFSKHNDPNARKEEYLAAIRFYRRFTKVYFLENSAYPVREDRDFPAEDDALRYVTYDKSSSRHRGKGYQEFEMLDRFVQGDLREDSFIKITGRYIYSNFENLYRTIQKQSGKWEAVVDTYSRRRMAFSSLFFVTKDAYLKHFLSMHEEMDDAAGRWAEHILFERLQRAHRYGFFKTLPLLRMISGADGAVVDYQRNKLSVIIKNIERRVFLWSGAKSLLF